MLVEKLAMSVSTLRITDRVDFKLKKLSNSTYKWDKKSKKLIWTKEDAERTVNSFWSPQVVRRCQAKAMALTSLDGCPDPSDSMPIWWNWRCLPICGRSYRNIGPLHRSGAAGEKRFSIYVDNRTVHSDSWYSPITNWLIELINLTNRMNQEK